MKIGRRQPKYWRNLTENQAVGLLPPFQLSLLSFAISIVLDQSRNVSKLLFQVSGYKIKAVSHSALTNC